MSNKIAIVLVVPALLVTPAFSQDIWVGKDGNIKNVDTRAMIVDGNSAYLATRGELYRSGDISQSEKWEDIFSLPPGENEITSLAGKGPGLLLGTKRGLFRSSDAGVSWRNVFRTMIPEKNHILSIEVSRYNPKRALISTVKGVFISEDSGSRWSDISANLKNKEIRCVALNKDTMYAAGNDGLYSRCPGQSAWERIYVNSSDDGGAEEGGSSEAVDTAYGEEEPVSSVNSVAVKKLRVYIGVDKGISYSDDGGASWIDLTKSGLSGTVNYVLPSKTSDRLYCATTKGVFEFDKGGNKWMEMYKGFDKSVNVARILFAGDDEKGLWALTEKGLYRMDAGRYAGGDYVDVEKGLKSFKITFDREPDFRELREAAMRFCDVSPKKITDWQRNSRIKALIPRVSVGIGKDRSTNTEIYTSATRDYSIVGPDDFSDSVDVSISWDLGNLIYSDDQTNIDVRSRLNTQLRNDILDDLRRIYYERKRLQFDVMAAPPKDLRARVEKELRIQELTQAIDDLTGNYLSDHMRRDEKGDKKGEDKGEVKGGVS